MAWTPSVVTLDICRFKARNSRISGLAYAK
jgi:hypothetical protein